MSDCCRFIARLRPPIRGDFAIRGLRRISLLFLITCVGVFFRAGTVGAEPCLDAEARNRIDAAFEQAVVRHTTPGGALIIGTADRILFARAYGRHTYDESSPAVTLDTIYDLASVSKAVGTTSATMLLVEDGKLGLDDPVSRFIPAWDRDDKRRITVRRVLTHTSGLPAYTSFKLVEADRRMDESKADALIRHIASLPLRYMPGTGFTYSCLNFITLARINEEVAGMSQERFLRARLFEPLGMRDTGYYLTDEQKSRAAPTTGGGTPRQGTVHDPLAAYLSDGYRCGGNAGLFSSASDLATFCRMFLSDGQWGERRVLRAETIDLFVRNSLPLRLRKVYGLGWGRYLSPPYAARLNRGYAKAALGHGGYTGTFVRMDRLSETFVVLLTNRVFPNDRASDGRLRRRILRIVLETDPLYRDMLPRTHRH